MTEKQGAPGMCGVNLSHDGGQGKHRRMLKPGSKVAQRIFF